MTTILNEQIIPLSEAPHHIPPFRGKRVHYSTLFRWVHRGARGRHLEVFHRGGRVYTSVEALHRFFTDGELIPKPQADSPHREVLLAEAALNAEGI